MIDVAIVGGGPAGSTCGTLLKKYNPHLRVVIFERETFPRDHVGESQLPVISSILHEMGVWDKVEAADFPIKIGATYRWGQSDKLWDFEFIPFTQFKDEPRPTKYQGQRRLTAFQVDRSRYDQILLDHAREMGCHVRENTSVRSAEVTGDKINQLMLDSGETVQARYYVDASGHAAILRRELGVGFEEPSSLRNVAVWDYWQNADWAVEIGVGGTRVQVLSVGYGWIWFIPLGPTRTSLGLIVPVSYLQSSGKKLPELYQEAIHNDQRVKELIRNATCEEKLSTTSDWSFVASRMAGENWFIVGEAAGFADPILAAGLTMAHVGAREAAYTILEIDRGEHGKTWLRHEFEKRNDRRIRQHIRFADYWYHQNGLFPDLIKHSQAIAAEAGLDLEPQEAWQWLGTGGFIDEDLLSAGVAFFGLVAVKVMSRMMGTEAAAEWRINQFNALKLNLDGATPVDMAQYALGRIHKIPCLQRYGKRLPLVGEAATVIEVLRERFDTAGILGTLQHRESGNVDAAPHEHFILNLQVLEAMLQDGWVVGKNYKSLPSVQLPPLGEIANVRTNADPAPTAA